MLCLHRNQNCYGLSPSVRRLLQDASHSVFSYPEHEARRLQNRLAQHHRLKPEQVVCGAGSSAVLRCALRQLSSLAQMRLFCTAPTYAVIDEMERQPIALSRLPLDASLSVNLPALRQLVSQHPGCSVVYLSHPDCHTGSLLDRDFLLNWISQAGEQVYFILDEAYMEFVPDAAAQSLVGLLHDCQANLLVLRTFSKAYGLAGLRIGYGLIATGWARGFSGAGLQDALNLLGVRAALESLDNTEWLLHSQCLLQTSRQLLTEGLTAVGLAWQDAPVNFVLHALPQNTEAFLRLLREDDLRLAYPIEGLPGWCRVTVGSPAEVSCYLNLLRALSA